MLDLNWLPLVAVVMLITLVPVPSETDNRQLLPRCQVELNGYTHAANEKPPALSGSGDGCRSNQPQVPRFAPSDVTVAVPASTAPQLPTASGASAPLTPVPALKKRCATPPHAITGFIGGFGGDGGDGGSGGG